MHTRDRVFNDNGIAGFYAEVVSGSEERVGLGFAWEVFVPSGLPVDDRVEEFGDLRVV